MPKDSAASSLNENSSNAGSDKSNSNLGSNSNSRTGNNGKVTNSPLTTTNSDKKVVATCNCNDVKSILKIRVNGNVENLTISCNGFKTAENIADLVDGYCRIVNDTEASLWDRTIGLTSTRLTPNSSATNSLEKHKQHHSLPPILIASQSIDSAKGHDFDVMKGNADGLINEMATPILNEDYVELGLGLGEEEGDYSTPTVRNYELDRTQIALNDIIGVGQFGDVHIGTCRINKPAKLSNSTSANDDCSSPKDGVPSANDDTDNINENGGTKTGIIHVAVKTCKADADMITSEKFLEEACK